MTFDFKTSAARVSRKVRGFVRHPMCSLGFHSVSVSTRWVPSIRANIVEEFHQVCRCRSCGITVGETHDRWDGKNMVPIVPNAHLSGGEAVHSK